MLIKIISLIGLIGSIAWVIAKPGYDSALAVVTAAAALVTSFMIQQAKKSLPNQSQTVGDNGFGIQAGGSVTVGNVEKKTEVK